jgi:hypothetical protein
VISIPDFLWERLLDEFARLNDPVERVAYLDGFRVGDQKVVTTVTIPDAELHAGYYDVTSAAMSQAGQHFRTYGLARLGQVHTHGGPGCGHSTRDDEAAYSQRIGSVSIVLPYHGQHRPHPTDGSVHIRRHEGWVALDTSQADAAVRLLPSLLDFRSQKWTVSSIATPEPSGTGLFQWIKRTVHRWWSRSRRN